MSEINYETRITQVVVVPEGEPTCSELATTIQIEDEAEGIEFLSIRQNLKPEAYVRIYPQEWPMLRAPFGSPPYRPTWNRCGGLRGVKVPHMLGHHGLSCWSTSRPARATLSDLLNTFSLTKRGCCVDRWT